MNSSRRLKAGASLTEKRGYMGLKEQLLETMRAKTARQQEIYKLIRTLDAVIGDSELLKRQLEKEVKEVEAAELHALQTLEALNRENQSRLAPIEGSSAAQIPPPHK